MPPRRSVMFSEPRCSTAVLNLSVTCPFSVRSRCARLSASADRMAHMPTPTAASVAAAVPKAASAVIRWWPSGLATSCSWKACRRSSDAHHFGSRPGSLTQILIQHFVKIGNLQDEVSYRPGLMDPQARPSRIFAPVCRSCTIASRGMHMVAGRLRQSIDAGRRTCVYPEGQDVGTDAVGDPDLVQFLADPLVP